MKILITYATTDGHTRTIAQSAFDWCAAVGHCVELLPVSDAGSMDIDRFDGVILAGSIHLGGYQKSLTEFCAARADALARTPNLFLSVSLSAASHVAEDWKGLDHILTDFSAATGWTPDRVAQIAGAYLPSKYDVFRRFTMARIVATREPDRDLGTDKIYTDWSALRETLADWSAGISARPAHHADAADAAGRPPGGA